MNDTEIPAERRPSFLNGWWFFFDVDEHQITVHGSALSGRERVWIDDEEVANLISWQFTTEHKLTLGGRPLIVEFGFENVWTGHVFCRVIRDGNVVASAEHRLQTKASFWISMLAGMVTGAIAGYVGAAIFGL